MRCKAAHWLWQLQHSLMLVFVETKKGSDALEDWLCCMDFPAATIHGDWLYVVQSSWSNCLCILLLLPIKLALSSFSVFVFPLCFIAWVWLLCLLTCYSGHLKMLWYRLSVNCLNLVVEDASAVNWHCGMVIGTVLSFHICKWCEGSTSLDNKIIIICIHSSQLKVL
jgi:hypothetical protein